MEPILEAITVLVVEDDGGDAQLVAELLDDAFPRIAFIRGTSSRRRGTLSRPRWTKPVRASSWEIFRRSGETGPCWSRSSRT